MEALRAKEDGKSRNSGSRNNRNVGCKMSERKKHPEAVNTARRLRIVMSMRGITSADIVRASRLGDGQVSNYLNGWTCMQLPALLELCRVLRCSADFLLGLSDTPTPRGLRFGDCHDE